MKKYINGFHWLCFIKSAHIYMHKLGSKCSTPTYITEEQTNVVDRVVVAVKL